MILVVNSKEFKQLVTNPCLPFGHQLFQIAITDDGKNFKYYPSVRKMLDDARIVNHTEFAKKYNFTAPQICDWYKKKRQPSLINYMRLYDAVINELVEKEELENGKIDNN